MLATNGLHEATLEMPNYEKAIVVTHLTKPMTECQLFPVTGVLVKSSCLAHVPVDSSSLACRRHLGHLLNSRTLPYSSQATNI